MAEKKGRLVFVRKDPDYKERTFTVIASGEASASASGMMYELVPDLPEQDKPPVPPQIIINIPTTEERWKWAALCGLLLWLFSEDVEGARQMVRDILLSLLNVGGGGDD